MAKKRGAKAVKKKVSHARAETAPKPPSKKEKPAAPSAKETVSFFSRVTHLFSRSRLDKDISKMKKLTEQELKHKEIEKKLFSHTGAAPKKAIGPRRRYKLSELLIKAGLDTDPAVFKKRVYLCAIFSSLLFSLTVAVLGNLNDRSAVDLLIFMAGFWTAGFALVLSLFSLAVASYLDVRIHNRTQQLEEVLPDYLQLVAANIGAGMPIDRALWFAIRPRFGVLAKEMEDVAKRVITGDDLPVALRAFTAKYDSAVLQRSVSLLLEGIAAGGKIADLLHKISTDITEQRILRQEMAANVTTYVIFISFASILAAPVLFGLSTQLLVVIQGITSTIPSTSSSSGLSVTPDVISLTNFRIFSVTLLVASSVMSALIVSIIRKGNMYESLRFIPAFIITSLVLYFLSVGFFGSIFGGLF